MYTVFGGREICSSPGLRLRSRRTTAWVSADVEEGGVRERLELSWDLHHSRASRMLQMAVGGSRREGGEGEVGPTEAFS